MNILSTRRPRSRAALGAAVAATLALSLAACSSDDAPADGASDEAADYGDISVQLSWIKNAEFIGEYMADTNGYYADAGFGTVNLVAGPSTGVAELVSGQALVALSDAVSVGTAVANEDAPVKIIGTTFQKNPFTVLSLKDGGDIATPQDMVGKKIGVQDSNVSLFNALLAANGISPDDVTVVPVQYDPSVLTNGEVDGFIAYLTNESLIVQAQGFEVTNLPFADNGLPFVAETVTVTDESIAEDREKLKAFLKAEIQGWTDAIADPEAAVQLSLDGYGKDLGLDKDTEIASATEQNDELVVSDETVANGLFTISPELQDETVASLANAGIDVEADDIFDLSLLDEVYSENPDLKDYEG
ncbi:ABC-type nitrate/sulfonate/bicarbonate transport system substrate-binding protein [Sediminihabitans luteus]|uniref:Thiamine pyrimidine synthase n=1 Tax=Sediminihabitans luteus TaxID=1138585 RepID=A0A2M9CYM7_9CELL|nr:ABC transporter substrate-binding protein [Sediminihabitans luteus]PJJ77042.1 ABC-type nitrate/sulfonate/bicarbonate transport system substrate-binding protein [Sediminihabitans luteus]